MLQAVYWQSLPIPGISEKKNREKTGEQITYLPRHIFEKQTKKLSKWRTLQAVPQQFLPIHGK